MEKLDYFTSPGYLDGGDAREKSGLYRPESGPSLLITQKGIFKFDETTKEMYLAQKHPLIALEDIQKDIPWELKVADDLKETEPPSQKEIEFIRRFAPAESLGRGLMTELTTSNLFKELGERVK